MAGQHTENLFRRFKGELATVRTLSGAVYEGKITEVTNDYLSLSETASGTTVYLFFHAIESLTTSASSPD